MEAMKEATPTCITKVTRHLEGFLQWAVKGQQLVVGIFLKYFKLQCNLLDKYLDMNLIYVTGMKGTR